MAEEDLPLARAGRIAFAAMLAVGTLVLIALVGLVKEAGNPVSLDDWSLALGYLCALLFGWRVAPGAANALAEGDSFLLGPLLGVGTFLIAGATGCLLFASIAEPSEPTETFGDLFITPFASWLLVGTVPALLVGGVFSAALTVTLPPRRLPPRRPPEGE